MGRPRFSPSLLISALLLLIYTPRTEPIRDPTPNPRNGVPYHPFCMSQFALANHACASIMYGPVSRHSSAQNDSNVFDELSHGHRHRGSAHKRRHHKSSSRHHRRHRRHHRHHHHSHHMDMEKAAVKECCMWMKAIEKFCICDMLVRLPSFLSRPVHKFVVVIDDLCKVDYKCPGRLMTTP